MHCSICLLYIGSRDQIQVVKHFSAWATSSAHLSCAESMEWLQAARSAVQQITEGKGGAGDGERDHNSLALDSYPTELWDLSSWHSLSSVPVLLKNIWFFTFVVPKLHVSTGISWLAMDWGMCFSNIWEHNLFLGVPWNLPWISTKWRSFQHLISGTRHRVRSCQQLSFQICSQGDSSARHRAQASCERHYPCTQLIRKRLLGSGLWV